MPTYFNETTGEEIDSWNLIGMNADQYVRVYEGDNCIKYSVITDGSYDWWMLKEYYFVDDTIKAIWGRGYFPLGSKEAKETKNKYVLFERYLYKEGSSHVRLNEKKIYSLKLNRDFSALEEIAFEVGYDETKLFEKEKKSILQLKERREKGSIDQEFDTWYNFLRNPLNISPSDSSAPPSINENNSNSLDF